MVLVVRFCNSSYTEQLPAWLRSSVTNYSNFGLAMRDMAAFFRNAEKSVNYVGKFYSSVRSSVDKQTYGSQKQCVNLIMIHDKLLTLPQVFTLSHVLIYYWSFVICCTDFVFCLSFHLSLLCVFMCTNSNNNDITVQHCTCILQYTVLTWSTEFMWCCTSRK